MERDEFKAVWLSLDEKFYRVAMVILRSEADAGDALQDLYVRLWGMRDRLDAVATPLSYGITVLRNICIDRLRARRPDILSDHYQSGTLSAAGNSDSALERRAREVPDEGGGTEGGLIGREAVARLRAVMQTLPENQRTVIDLRFFRQLDNTEIARRTGLSEVNVRTLLSRARNTIRKQLEDYI